MLELMGISNSSHCIENYFRFTMDIHVHQTHHSIGDFKKIYQHLEDNFKEDNPGLHIFPELFLTGYPLQDLCLTRPFIDSYLLLLEKINHWSQSQFSKIFSESSALLMGGLHYTFDKEETPLIIKNVIYVLIPGKKLEVLYVKRLLPNYDIYDEKKYFTEGQETKIWSFNNKNIALLICEDMWPSNLHQIDPIKEIKKKASEENLKIDLIVNVSGSPFHVGKLNRRIDRAQQISNELLAPMVYVNRVGGEDEILFDGASFVIDGSENIKYGKLFEQDYFKFPFPETAFTNYKNESNHPNNTWESLFLPQISSLENNKAILSPLSTDDIRSILSALQFGILEYARKNKFKKFLVALSGGMDSSLVLAIIRLLLKDDQDVEAIYMPGAYSSTLSRELSEQLCANLGIKLHHLPIKFFHSSIKNEFLSTFGSPLEGVTDENIQSRLRGTLLYMRSNFTGSMVLNTSNKSELAVGYSTQYGDSVGALSVLGDLYKSEVYQLAEYINEEYRDIIPRQVIERPPTAELRKNQVDSDSLPPYEILDGILEGFLSYKYAPSDLVYLGFSKTDVEKVFSLFQKSEFKRFQFCPIIKVKPKSFGFGYRVPICKANREYI